MDDTIFAMASGRGRAGVAVLRLSGPRAADALRRLTSLDLPAPRQASLRHFRDPRTGETLDRGLAIWFPAPRSYTGEDVVELHLHAGAAVVTGVAEALAAMPGLRPAEPGEFTRRAFLNGKLDLTSAEGVADLVAAETAAQRRQALGQMEGTLARLYEDWRGRLVKALALVEAGIDFADEDVPVGVIDAGRATALALEREIRLHLADGHRGERLRDGVSVAILGPPNAGKSTLLNRLAQRDAAIVSPVAGTTRDVIDIDIDLDGYPVRIADTAGLRPTGDAIEAEGVRRARPVPRRPTWWSWCWTRQPGRRWIPRRNRHLGVTPWCWSTRSTCGRFPSRRPSMASRPMGFPWPRAKASLKCARRWPPGCGN